MNPSDTWPTPKERLAALERQSTAHLEHASNVLWPNPSVAGAAAFEAGYFALMSAVTPEELRQFAEHPSVAAAEKAAARLGLSKPDSDMARQGAADFYAPGRLRFAEAFAWFEWAARVRRSAGWDR